MLGNLSAYTLAALAVLLAVSLHGTLEVCSRTAGALPPSRAAQPHHLGSPAAPPPPPPPPPQQQQQRPPGVGRTAVLAISRGSDFDGVFRYASSVRRHCPDTEIVIFTDAASLAGNAALGPMLAMYGVTVVLVTEDYVPAVARGYHPVSQRWLVVRTWMRARAEAAAAGREPPIDTLMFSDARDMYFQGDPFALLEQHEGGGRGFYAFIESHDTIGGSEWNFKWVADCFGSAGLAEIERFPVVCAGTSMGSWDDAMAYVELICACARAGAPPPPLVAPHPSAHPAHAQTPTLFPLPPASILLEKAFCERNGVDQGMHNYIVWAGVLEKHVSALHLVNNEEGVILNAGIMRALERDNAGRVLTLSGVVAAAVHQYDRFPALQAQIETANPWLQENLRLP